MQKIFKILLISLLLTSCNFKEKGLSALWFFNYTKDEADSSLSPVCFIDLQKDGTYTRDFGQFDYGTWTYKDDRIRLTDEFHKTTQLKINSFSFTELLLNYHNNLQVFKRQPRPSIEKDPFSKENNLWRIQANKKENEKELKDRLINHVKFWEKYFTWALDNDIKSIDVRSLPTPIKIYGNGFSVKEFKDLPQRWKSFFYDDNDCMNANAMLWNVVKNEDIAWPHTDNKYEAFISVFQQLQLKLRTSNFAHEFTPPKNIIEEK